MAREISDENTSHRDAAVNNYRNDAKRTPTNHRGSSDVPVLFRFRNLQKAEELEPALPSRSNAAGSKADESRKSSLETIDPQDKRSHLSKGSVGGSSRSASPLAKADSEKSKELSKPILENASASNPLTDPLIVSAKHTRPWSTNVILLCLGIAVLFILSQRNTTGQPSIADAGKPSAENDSAKSPDKSQSMLGSSALSDPAGQKALLVAFPDKPDSNKLDSFNSVAPLAAPKLPDPMELSLDEGLASESNKLVGNDSSLKAPSTDAFDSSSLEVPSSSSTGSSAGPNELTAHKSVMIPQSTSESSSREKQDSFLGQTSASRPNAPTVITNPHVAMLKTDGQSTQQASGPTETKRSSPLVSTSTPELETAELFELRNRLGSATMQSQQQAMARNRMPAQSDSMQPQWNMNAPAASQPFNVPTTTVSGPAQPPMVYTPPSTPTTSYQYQPVQPAPAGYGAVNSNAQSSNVPSTNAPAAVNKPYIPISATLAADPYSPDLNMSPTQVPQWQIPETNPMLAPQNQIPQGQFQQNQIPTNQIPQNLAPQNQYYSGQTVLDQYSAAQSSARPYPSTSTGGYQPLSPQFQSQPMNGN